jgi:hypothetical protein
MDKNPFCMNVFVPRPGLAEKFKNHLLKLLWNPPDFQEDIRGSPLAQFPKEESNRFKAGPFYR